MMDLSKKNVIITGASKGIGENLANSFFSYKSNLFLISRNEKKLQIIKNQFNKKKSPEQTIQCYGADITNQSEISDIFKECEFPGAQKSHQI